MLEIPHKRTFYFIGVTTSKSSIMKIFPNWIKALGLPDTRIQGCDIKLHGPREKYREIILHIKNNELAIGGLVTTHKIDIVKHAGDLFDEFGEYAKIFGEISSISKRNGKLWGHAKDPITVGLALQDFLPENYWINHSQSHVFIMGAGGSGLSLSAYLMRKDHGNNVPSKIIISNRSRGNLEHTREVHERLGYTTEVEYVQIGHPRSNDDIVKDLPEGSLIVNATGMGKDRPGSPVSETTIFPKNSYIWEFNYRGSLEFYHHALIQKEKQNLHVEDGWRYFIHGWTQVIAEVFHINIANEKLNELSSIAEKIAR